MTESKTGYLNRALFYFYALFAFSSTFSIALAQTSLGISLILFIIVAIREKYQPFVRGVKWFYLTAAGYTFWLLLSAVVNDTPLVSIAIIKEEWLFLAVPIGIYLFTNEDYRKKLMYAWFAGIALLSIYGLVQYLTGANWFRSGELSEVAGFGYRVQGNFSVRLTFANYYGTAAMFLCGFAACKGSELSHRTKIILLLVALAAVIASALTFSRGVTLACGLVILLTGLLLGKKYHIPVVALVAVLIVSVFTIPGIKERFSGGLANDLNPEYEGGRLFIWNNSIDIIKDNPVFGVGQGNFYYHYKDRLRPDIPEYRQLTHAHSDPLNMAAVAGIPGAILFELMWAAMFLIFLRAYLDRSRSEWERRVSLAALLGSVLFWLSALTEATFADEEVRQMLMFVWAAGLSVRYKDQKTAKIEKH